MPQETGNRGSAGSAAKGSAWSAWKQEKQPDWLGHGRGWEQGRMPPISGWSVPERRGFTESAVPEQLVAGLDGWQPEEIDLPFWESSTLAPESSASLAHDARSLATAIELLSGLLEEPGVLAERYLHYASELRQLGRASSRILERLAGSQPSAWLRQEGLPANPPEDTEQRTSVWSPYRAQQTERRGVLSPNVGGPPVAPVRNLAEELIASKQLLEAIAGPAVTVGLSIYGGQQPISMHSEDLTRVLVNLCRNAVDAMPEGGHIQVDLSEDASSLSLCFSDTGCGIPEGDLESIFFPGFSTHVPVPADGSGAENIRWPVQRRGLGLAIIRSIVAAAGGQVWAANRREEGPSHPASALSAEAGFGAMFTLSFPLASGTRRSQGSVG